MTHGTVNWTELNTHDVAKAKDFYGKTLRWTFDDMPMGEGMVYTIAKLGDEQIVGITPMQPGMENVPDYWFTYFTVDNLDAVLEIAVDTGGTVIQQPFDIPGIGKVAIIADGNGTRSGWMIPAPTM